MNNVNFEGWAKGSILSIGLRRFAFFNRLFHGIMSRGSN